MQAEFPFNFSSLQTEQTDLPSPEFSSFLKNFGLKGNALSSASVDVKLQSPLTTKSMLHQTNAFNNILKLSNLSCTLYTVLDILQILIYCCPYQFSKILLTEITLFLK